MRDGKEPKGKFINWYKGARTHCLFNWFWGGARGEAQTKTEPKDLWEGCLLRWPSLAGSCRMSTCRNTRNAYKCRKICGYKMTVNQHWSGKGCKRFHLLIFRTFDQGSICSTQGFLQSAASALSECQVVYTLKFGCKQWNPTQSEQKALVNKDIRALAPWVCTSWRKFFWASGSSGIFWNLPLMFLKCFLGWLQNPPDVDIDLAVERPAFQVGRGWSNFIQSFCRRKPATAKTCQVWSWRTLACLTGPWRLDGQEPLMSLLASENLFSAFAMTIMWYAQHHLQWPAKKKG